MRFLGKSLTGLFFLALTLGLLGYAGILVRDAVQARLSDEAPERPARERVFAVNVVPVAFGTETPVLQAFGEVASRRTLEIRAATGGTVIELSPDFVEGGQVASGQVLARIDPADAEAARARAESDLLDAQAEAREADRAIVLARDELAAARDQVDLRDRALQRQRDLSDRGVGTAAALEDAEFALSSARQQVLTRRQALATAEARIDQAATRLKRAEIALDEAQRRLDETEIAAAFTGTLSDVTVVAGRLVSPNEQLARLVDPRALEVAFRVSTRQYARLIDAAGTLRTAPVTVTLDVAGEDIVATGRLAREGAAVGEGQTGRLLFADLGEARGFKPGDFVTVSVAEPPLPRVARLPAMAVDAAGTVLVVGADDRLETAPVEILRRQGDDVLVRADGLEGREVVAQRTPLLGEGIRVRPLRGPGAEAAPDSLVDLPGTRRAEGNDPAGGGLVSLSPQRRAALRGAVEADPGLPEAARTRILAQLSQDRVPARVVARIESRAGG